MGLRTTHYLKVELWFGRMNCQSVKIYFRQQSLKNFGIVEKQIYDFNSSMLMVKVKAYPYVKLKHCSLKNDLTM